MSNPPKENYIETVNGHSFKMIFVKGGTFGMGKSQKHMVTVPDFHIGEFPVTQVLWKAVMGQLPARIAFIGDNRPVERVSWDDIVKGTGGESSFLDELNKRATLYKNYKLPSEAMWEFAARARGKRRKHDFAGSERLKEVAWYDENSGGETKPVGLKLPNELGIYGMSGNIWEWCGDDWGGEFGVNDNVNHIPSNGLYYKDIEMNSSLVRGGSWDLIDNGCHVSYRGPNNHSDRSNNIGFRLVLY